jgi:large subunit ribosomal protein L23
MNQYFILKKPIITEKSLKAVKLNRYTFEVDVRASKDQVRQAVTNQFKVEVTKVNMVKSKGTAKRTGRKRLPSMTTDSKKAIVTLKAGQSIKLFEAKS